MLLQPGVLTMRFEVRGIVDGHPAVILEHITRLRDDLRPVCGSDFDYAGCARESVDNFLHEHHTRPSCVRQDVT